MHIIWNGSFKQRHHVESSHAGVQDSQNNTEMKLQVSVASKEW